MSVNSPPRFPDYDLDDRRVITSPIELKALAHPIREAILDLLLERAATITELALALQRPKSTLAHHVSVLVKADMLKVVRARKVRAIEEKTYGRTARLFAVGAVDFTGAQDPPWGHPLADAARRSEDAYRADTMWSNTRRGRIRRDTAREFWMRVEELVDEFTQLPREGDATFAFTVALYPTDFPTLPDAVDR